MKFYIIYFFCKRNQKNVREPLMPVTYGHCDASPMVTVSAARHQSPPIDWYQIILLGNMPRVSLDTRVAGI